MLESALYNPVSDIPDIPDPIDSSDVYRMYIEHTRKTKIDDYRHNNSGPYIFSTVRSNIKPRPRDKLQPHVQMQESVDDRRPLVPNLTGRYVFYQYIC